MLAMGGLGWAKVRRLRSGKIKHDESNGTTCFRPSRNVESGRANERRLVRGWRMVLDLTQLVID